MFISYAQNFEDVILNRLFAQRETGFYIDVGAQHPLYDSVTKAFYDRGWRGINIEPVKKYYDILQQARERDFNLNLALGKAESTLEFYELEDTGLSTFDSQTASEIASKNGYKILTYRVPVKTLADISQQYVTEQIDFLKIDVEGWEENVILGHDWDRFRPIVVLLEATIPNSPVRTQTNIRQILKSKNYEYVYFDGLNDYYLAAEHSELTKHFQTPPNVFDKFVSYHLIEAQIASQKERELQILHNKQDRETRDRLLEQIGQLQAQLSEVRQLVTAMEASKFWKLRSAWFKLKKLVGIQRD